MRYKRLQKIGMCTTFNVTQRIYFLKEGEKLLQQGTMRYKRLQKIGMCTTLNVTQRIYFLKEGEKLL